MGQLTVYNFITINGFFKGLNEDISWAHRMSSEDEQKFAAQNAGGGATLVFGRVTYDMMKSYWPSEQAKKNNAGVAEGMNKAEKIVFSRTLTSANWENTRIVNNDIEDEIKKLKEAGKKMTILGSGSIVNQLTDAGLIDEYQLMIYPVAIPAGTSFLQGTKKNVEFEFIDSRDFLSGAMLHIYRPKKS